MFKLFILATVLSLCLGKESAKEASASEAVLVPEEHRHREQRVRGDWVNHRGGHDRHRDDRLEKAERNRDDHDDHNDHGPLILRTINPHHDGHNRPDIERQNKIIEHVYGPDYAEPTWIIDYRYLKTGGRDYTRGPGGQIIILPKGIRTKEHKEFNNYDELIEHLRQKNMAERSKPSYFVPLGQPAADDDRDDHWQHDRHDDRNWWKDH